MNIGRKFNVNINMPCLRHINLFVHYFDQKWTGFGSYLITTIPNCLLDQLFEYFMPQGCLTSTYNHQIFHCNFKTFFHFSQRWKQIKMLRDCENKIYS